MNPRSMSLLSHRRSAHGLAIAGLTLALTWLAYQAGMLEQVEWIGQDWRAQLLRSDRPASERVAVILIDEAAIRAMDKATGRWPWPRSLHADIIEFLELGLPQAIVFDILFTEQQRAPGTTTTDQSPDDQRLIQATRQAGAAIHAMQILTDVPDETNAALLDRPLPATAKARAVANAQVPTGHPANAYYLPFDGLYHAARRLAVVNMDPDRDGTYRRVKLLHGYQGSAFPSLGLAPVLEALKPSTVIQADTRLQLGDLTVPLDANGRYLINHYGTVKTYSMSGVIASAQRLLQGDTENLLIDPAEFADKIVFIGASAAGLDDLKATPLNATAPGVLLHAATAANLLEQDFLRPIPGRMTALLTVLLVAITTLSILRLDKIALQVGIPALLAFGYLGLSLWAYRHNYLLDLAAPLLAPFAACGACFIYLAATEGRDKRRVRRMLAQYVSPAVLNEVVARYQDQLQAEVGSEEHLSILFSDIRGFTSLSEAMPPAKVVELLNRYFSEMTDAIFVCEGTIDKFIGDAIMAFWGAPIKDPRHADKSLAAAIEMHRRLQGVNDWLRTHGYPQIAIGIGINSGNVILGNIGSTQKLDYTVIGDNVNLASRLEGLTKVYGVAIVLSEYTYALLEQPLPCHTLDLVRVKGKSRPLMIYGPILDETRERAAALANLSAQGFTAYRERRWDEAIALYSNLPPSELRHTFIERCVHFRATPPPPDWDGVFVLTSK